MSKKPTKIQLQIPTSNGESIFLPITELTLQDKVNIILHEAALAEDRERYQRSKSKKSK